MQIKHRTKYREKRYSLFWVYHVCFICLMVFSATFEGVQHYVIKFLSDLQQVGGFFRVLRFPPPINLTTTIYITETLLKVALNTIKQIKQTWYTQKRLYRFPLYFVLCFICIWTMLVFLRPKIVSNYLYFLFFYLNVHDEDCSKDYALN
jgi:hypothetical protein